MAFQTYSPAYGPPEQPPDDCQGDPLRERKPYPTREQVMIGIFGPELGPWFHREPAAQAHYFQVMDLAKQERDKGMVPARVVAKRKAS